MIVLQYALAILGLSMIIMVHEFGHFIFARISGMHVEEFFLGFGPQLFKHKAKNGTVYGIKAIPVGGYVKVFGMDRRQKIPDEKKNESFYNKNFFRKLLVIIGGAGLNTVFAVVLIWIFLSMGVVAPTNTIDYVHPETPADISGFEAGDKVVALDGEKIESWDDFVRLNTSHPGEEVTYTVIRNGEEVVLPVELDDVEGEGFLGVSPGYIEKRLGFGEIITEGFKMTWDIGTTYVKLFGMLFSGQLSFDEARPVSPVGIVSIFQQSVAMGFQNFLLFIALVSIIVGFGNLLPILPLDGGNIILIIIESIRKRPIPIRVFEVINSIGIFIMISILLVGFVFDIINPFRINNM
jgi:regulator of sigma E protease